LVERHAGYGDSMSDFSERDQVEEEEEHEGLDAETILQDAEQLFEPDNKVVPPPQPDAPPD
jgi:hypothetical protein